MGNAYFDWKERVVYAPEGPKPQAMVETEKAKVVVAGLEAGQRVPEHPESMGVYYFVEGEGVMVVDGECYEVSPGSIVVASQGAVRGVEALTRLVFVATRVK